MKSGNRVVETGIQDRVREVTSQTQETSTNVHIYCIAQQQEFLYSLWTNRELTQALE